MLFIIYNASEAQVEGPTDPTSVDREIVGPQTVSRPNNVYVQGSSFLPSEAHVNELTHPNSATVGLQAVRLQNRTRGNSNI